MCDLLRFTERVRKVEIRRRYETIVRVTERMNQSVLKWFGDIEKSRDGMFVKGNYIVEGNREREREREREDQSLHEVMR